MTSDLKEALRLLNSSEVIGIPTETVYGLAAKIDSEVALQKIFSLKERPLFDPLIVHVTDALEAKKWVLEWDDLAEHLAEKFWPGPLTLVLKKSQQVSDLITAGLPTVALRSPNHTLTLELLKLLDVPLAAPSANKFTRTSPTTSEHVRREFSDLFVLDGGACVGGIESTILQIDKDNEKYNLQILRPGLISSGEILSAVEELEEDFQFLNKSGQKITAPGQFKEHYRPAHPLVIVDGDINSQTILTEVNKRAQSNYTEVVELSLPSEAVLAARHLYASLHRLAGESKVIVYNKQHPKLGEHWSAIEDRLTRAASFSL